MPTYTYRCTSCRAVGEAYRKIDDRNNCPRCTQCGGGTEKLLDRGIGVAVFTPYRTVAHDKEQGRNIMISSRGEHEAYLRRNGYEEIGNDKSAMPLPAEQVAENRARKLKEIEADGEPQVFDFNDETHEAALPTEEMIL